MLINLLKRVLFRSNRSFDKALYALVKLSPTPGCVHINSCGIGDILVMLPYYKRLLEVSPCDQLWCTQAMTLAAVERLLPEMTSTWINWFRFRYDPVYRARKQAGKRYNSAVAEFPFDRDTLDTFSLFRAEQHIATDMRHSVSPPPEADFRIIHYPEAHKSHITKFLRLYFGELWKEHSAEDFDCDDSPEAYRKALRAAFPDLPDPKFVKPGERYICLSNTPTCKYRWYPKEAWQKIADGLPREVKIFHLGSGDLNIDHPGYSDLNGKTTLEQAVALILNADLFIGVETGLLHAAYMGGTKTVCILGGGHLGHYLPWDKFSGSLKCAFQDLPCSACNWCCPYVDFAKDEIPPCITGITPEKVLALVKEFGVT